MSLRDTIGRAKYNLRRTLTEIAERGKGGLIELKKSILDLNST